MALIWQDWMAEMNQPLRLTGDENRRERKARQRGDYTAAVHYRLDHVTRWTRLMRRMWQDMTRCGGRALDDMAYEVTQHLI